MDEVRSLTRDFVAGTPEPGIYRDDKEKGFCLKVTPAGRKVYQVRKRVKGEEQKTTVTIGVAEETTLSKAREEAKRQADNAASFGEHLKDITECQDLHHHHHVNLIDLMNVCQNLYF